MKAPFDPDLLARIEDAGINASAPREQRWVDGWLVRFSPGKAKRARCVQPVAPGRLPVEAKLARCLPIFAAAGLQPYVRITPFAQPEGLDARLASLGMEAIDDTQVMVAELAAARQADGAMPPDLHELRLESVGGDRYAEWVGAQRGSTPEECRAHADRLRHSPVPYRAVVARLDAGAPVAGGQVAIEGDLAGLYDVFTAPGERGRRLAEAVCRGLLDGAAVSGARIAYLQVDAGNAAARALYRRMGFADAYAYHYRTPATA